jgi:hypothetical protein
VVCRRFQIVAADFEIGASADTSHLKRTSKLLASLV